MNTYNLQALTRANLEILKYGVEMQFQQETTCHCLQ